MGFEQVWLLKVMISVFEVISALEIYTCEDGHLEPVELETVEL